MLGGTNRLPSQIGCTEQGLCLSIELVAMCKASYTEPLKDCYA